MMSAWDLHKAWPEADFRVRIHFGIFDVFVNIEQVGGKVVCWTNYKIGILGHCHICDEFIVFCSFLYNS